MRQLGSKFSVFSRALAIANGRSLQTQKFAPPSFQIYEFIFCEWYHLFSKAHRECGKTAHMYRGIARELWPVNGSFCAE